MTSFISFARRHNPDTSVDSICTRCYQTVANSQKVDDLDCEELRHVCDPYSAILLNGVDQFKHAV
jgi:hypothetical protein